MCFDVDNLFKNPYMSPKSSYFSLQNEDIQVGDGHARPLRYFASRYV